MELQFKQHTYDKIKTMCTFSCPDCDNNVNHQIMDHLWNFSLHENTNTIYFRELPDSQEILIKDEWFDEFWQALSPKNIIRFTIPRAMKMDKIDPYYEYMTDNQLHEEFYKSKLYKVLCDRLYINVVRYKMDNYVLVDDRFTTQGTIKLYNVPVD